MSKEVEQNINEGTEPNTEVETTNEATAEEVVVVEEATTPVSETEGAAIQMPVEAEGTNEATVTAEDTVTETPTPSIEELLNGGAVNNNEPKNKSKMPAWLIALIAVAAVAILVIGGIAGYFLFFARTTVDVFYDVEFVIEGTEGRAHFVDGVQPTTDDEAINNGLNSVLYYEAPGDEFKNGDVITVTAVVDQELLDQYRLTPETLTQEYTVTGLSTVPATIGDIPGEADLRNEAKGVVEGFKQKDIDDALAQNADSSFVSDDLKLYAIAYKQDVENCDSGQTSMYENCGTIQYIYSHTIETESPGWTHTMSTWRIYGMTSLQVSPEGKLLDHTRFIAPANKFDTNNDGLISNDEMKAGYEKLGYTFTTQ